MKKTFIPSVFIPISFMKKINTVTVKPYMFEIES